ncbi:hypothetical protein [Chryseobacterium tongliaoense]|uniref:hypothetical protein n=1 Tax=Chryseobacterium tongliaoense TaxID=3240933 RepID=UPI003510EA12
MNTNIKISFLTFLLSFQVFFAQDVEYGKYVSKSGSFLVIKKNKKFYFQKEKTVKLDITSKEIIAKSFGNFERKNNMLLFTTTSYDSIAEKSFKLEELDKSSNDSINIRFKKYDELIKVYICGTGLENSKRVDDTSSCMIIGNNTKLPKFYSEKFYFKIYPNLDDWRMRSDYNINTISFTTKNYKNMIHNNLLIDTDFDTTDFALEKFESDIAIIENKKIIFKGEEFLLESKK